MHFEVSEIVPRSRTFHGSNEYSGAENCSFPATIRNFIHALLNAKFTPALYMKFKIIRISVSVMVILAVAAFVGLRYWPADKAPNIVLIVSG